MNHRGQLITFALLGALSALAAAGALAWACTPQAHTYVTPASGPPGSQVTVTGRGFSEGPVQIYWNAAEGAPLATATGPTFSVSVKVPDAAPGVYYIVARGYAADGGVAGDATRAFKVRGAPASQPQRGAPEPARHTLTAAHRGASRGEPELATPPSPAKRAVQAPVKPAVKAAPSVERRVLAAGRARPPASTGRREDGAAASPSRWSVSGDLWSGFRAAGSPPPNLGLAGGAATGEGPGWQLPAGIGLLGIGLVGLLVASAVAGTRRRREATGPLGRD